LCTSLLSPPTHPSLQEEEELTDEEEEMQRVESGKKPKEKKKKKKKEKEEKKKKLSGSRKADADFMTMMKDGMRTLKAMNSVQSPSASTSTSGATPPPPPSSSSLTVELTRLKEIHEAGLINADEYAAAKKKLLGL